MCTQQVFILTSFPTHCCLLFIVIFKTLFCKDFNLIGMQQFWLRELYAFTQAHQFCFEWTCVKYFNSLLMRETGNVAASSKIRNMEMNLQMKQNWLIPQRGREVSCTSGWPEGAPEPPVSRACSPCAVFFSPRIISPILKLRSQVLRTPWPWLCQIWGEWRSWEERGDKPLPFPLEWT